MSSSLPDGFRFRPATIEDAPAINELVIAVDTEVQGWSDSTTEELLGWWRETDLAGNSWVVEDDSLAAYAVVVPHGESADIDGYVHPAKTGLGLGSWLLRQGEELARERGLPAVLTWCLAPDVDARALSSAPAIARCAVSTGCSSSMTTCRPKRSGRRAFE